MSGNTKQISHAGARAGKEIRLRFLPEIEIPTDLPDGPVAIADMANAFGVTHRTLHFYEEKGLISAGRIGPMRIYGSDSIAQMAIINTCREVGMPVAVIQELMEELDGAATQDEADAVFRRALAVRRRELVSGLSTIHRQMEKVTSLLDSDPIHVGEDNPSLTDAEHRCLGLMAQGFAAPKIARQMERPLEEIEAMETAIMRKFNASNRFQAVARAAALGMAKAD